MKRMAEGKAGSRAAAGTALVLGLAAASLGVDAAGDGADKQAHDRQAQQVTAPQGRKQFKAGTLSIASAMPQKGAECEGINYDPLVMADGIAPTNDPILQFRSPAYAVSFAKRRSGS